MNRTSLVSSCRRVLALSALVGAPSMAAAQTPFNDHCDAALRPEWIVKNGSAWVPDGWVHLLDTVPAFPRYSVITLHEGDLTWNDYIFQARCEPILTAAPDGPWMRGGMVWRATNSFSASDTGYALQFVLPGDSSGTSRLDFSRSVNGAGVMLQQITPFTPTLPMDVLVSSQGHHIQVFINGSLTIDVVDSAGPLAGGVGVWNVWESEGRYDDILVAPIPSECPGDADGNGVVEFADVTSVLSNFLSVCP